MAFGDFNKDNRLDIIVTSATDSSVSLFLQYNRGALQYGATYTSGDASDLRYFAMADMNSDTYLDIVVASYGSNNIGLLFGHGNGNFRLPQFFDTGPNSHPANVVIADFNHDSFLDIVVANDASNTVPVFLGKEQGAFEIHTPYQTNLLSASSSITSVDFNNDGRSELVVAYTSSDNVNIVLPYDIGFSSNSARYQTGYWPQSVAVDDLNNDARLDIVVINGANDSVSVLLGYGNGSFADQVTYSTGSFPCSVALGDFNNDNRLDIAVVNQNNNSMSVLLGDGNGAFATQMTYPTGATPYSVVLGDFNNDTQLDAIVSNRADNSVSALLGYGNGSFAIQITYPTGPWPSPVALGDFNNDARLDIVVVSGNTANMSVLLGYGNGSFTNQLLYSTGPFLYQWSGDTSVAVGDFNNDTRLDIVVVRTPNNIVSILFGYGNGSFATPVMYPIGSFPSSVAVGDFNNDTQLDIIVANSNDNNVGILLGYGNGSFATQVLYSTGVGPSSIAVGDFNNDTRLDIVIVDSSSSDVVIFLGYWIPVFVKQTTLVTQNSSRSRSFVVRDFNNDGHLDIGIANSDTDNIEIFLGHGRFNFTREEVFSTGLNSSPQSIAAGDFNNDTFMDVVVANSKWNSMGVFLGYGNGSFAKQITYPTGDGPQSASVGDLNNDAILDVVVANYRSNNLGIFLGHGDGTFAEMITVSLKYASHPFSVLIGDFNNDRKLDLAVANDGTDTLYILLQTC